MEETLLHITDKSINIHSDSTFITGECHEVKVFERETPYIKLGVPNEIYARLVGSHVDGVGYKYEFKIDSFDYSKTGEVSCVNLIPTYIDVTKRLLKLFEDD